MTLQFIDALPFLGFKLQKDTLEDKLHAQKLHALRKSLDDCKKKLHYAQDNFNNVTEPRLIDFYIYKIQAEQSRYEQLLMEYRKEESSYIHASA